MAAHAALSDDIGIPPIDSLRRVEFVERGLPTEKLDLLKQRGFNSAELADTIIAPGTLKHRKRRRENLSSRETDRTIRLCHIVDLADRVFGDPQRALMWLRHPNNRLKDRPPLSFLKTESGGRWIESMLWAIDQGIFS